MTEIPLPSEQLKQDCPYFDRCKSSSPVCKDHTLSYFDSCERYKKFKRKENFNWNLWFTAGIILIVILFATIILFGFEKPVVEESTAKCIGEHSILYTQNGCSHCIETLELFGEYKSYLIIVDCLEDMELCSEHGIESTPTWILYNGTRIEGYRSMQELKDSMGC